MTTIIEKLEKRETALKVDELGAMLNTSPKTLYKAIKSGRLVAMRVGGIKIDPADAVEWLRARRTR